MSNGRRTRSAEGSAYGTAVSTTLARIGQLLPNAQIIRSDVLNADIFTESGIEKRNPARADPLRHGRDPTGCEVTQRCCGPL